MAFSVSRFAKDYKSGWLDKAKVKEAWQNLTLEDFCKKYRVGKDIATNLLGKKPTPRGGARNFKKEVTVKTWLELEREKRTAQIRALEAERKEAERKFGNYEGDLANAVTAVGI